MDLALVCYELPTVALIHFQYISTRDEFAQVLMNASRQQVAIHSEASGFDGRVGCRDREDGSRG